MQKSLIVIAKDNNKITLANAEEGCTSCLSKGVCGVGVLSKLAFKTIIQNNNNNNKQIGDLVQVEINNKELVKNAFLLYLLPIISLFLGSSLANILFKDNLILQLIMAILFFLLPFLFIYLKKT